MNTKTEILQNAKRIIYSNKILKSISRHDFVEDDYYDSDEAVSVKVFVDGGTDYIRGTFDNPKFVEDLILYEDTPFDEIKKKLVWGTYGISGKEPLKYVKLVECTKDHLENILKLVRKKYESSDSWRHKVYLEVIDSILEDMVNTIQGECPNWHSCSISKSKCKDCLLKYPCQKHSHWHCNCGTPNDIRTLKEKKCKKCGWYNVEAELELQKIPSLK